MQLPWRGPSEPQTVQRTGPLGVAAFPPGLPTGPWGGAVQAPLLSHQTYAMTVSLALAYPVIQIARKPADSFAPGAPAAIARNVGPPALVAPSNSSSYDQSPGAMLAGEQAPLAVWTSDVRRRETSVT